MKDESSKGPSLRVEDCGEMLMPQVSTLTTISVYALDIPVRCISIYSSYLVSFHTSSRIIFVHGLVSYKAHDPSRAHDLQYLHFETE